MLSNNIALKLPLEPAINFYYMIYEFFQFSGMSNPRQKKHSQYTKWILSKVLQVLRFSISYTNIHTRLIIYQGLRAKS